MPLPHPGAQRNTGSEEKKPKSDPAGEPHFFSIRATSGTALQLSLLPESTISTKVPAHTAYPGRHQRILVQRRHFPECRDFGIKVKRRDPAFSGHSIFIVCCRRNREHLLRCRFRCQIVFRLSDLFAFPVPKGLLFWQVFCRLSVREFVSLPSFERLQTFFNKRKLSRKNAHAPQHCARRLRQP